MLVFDRGKITGDMVSIPAIETQGLDQLGMWIKEESDDDDDDGRLQAKS